MRDYAVAQSRALYFVRAAYTIIEKGKNVACNIHVKYFRKTAVSTAVEPGDNGYEQVCYFLFIRLWSFTRV